MNKVKRIARVLASVCVASTCFTAMNISANAEGETDTSDYTLTIPATLAVANSGWNATDGISATGTLAQGKKLTVTASSDDEFALVAGENKVNYKLAASGDTNTTYANATEKTSWEFKTLSETATNQPMGIIVDDYSTKPAGDYSDTVTFTASVASANPYAAKAIGDEVTFGNYSWYIIGKSDDGVTLLMENNLENKKKYNDSYTDVTWATCSLRTYLNETFYNTFSNEDKAKIVKTSNTNPNNGSVSGGNNTEDYIYLLSIAEANTLINTIRRANGSEWWLRSPGYSSKEAAFVDEDGDVNSVGYIVAEEKGVRPALNLKF